MARRGDVALAQETIDGNRIVGKSMALRGAAAVVEGPLEEQPNS